MHRRNDESVVAYYCNLCRARTRHSEVLSHWDNTYYVDKTVYTLVRCLTCGLVEVENKPAADALASYYPANYYSYDTSGSIFFGLKAAAARMTTCITPK